jgi:hypothetical protein
MAEGDSVVPRATQLTERRLADDVKPLLEKEGFEILAPEVRLGAFRFDMLAKSAEGELVVIELKTCMALGTLAQLLIYPHAIQQYLRTTGREEPTIRAMLVTTFLDENVVEIAARLACLLRIDIRLCVDTEDGGLELCSPPFGASSQVWNQAEVPTRGDPENSKLEAVLKAFER